MNNSMQRFKLAKELYRQTRNCDESMFMTKLVSFLEQYDNYLMDELKQYEDKIIEHHLKCKAIITALFNNVISDEVIRDNIRTTIQNSMILNRDKVIENMKQYWRQQDEKKN